MSKFLPSIVHLELFVPAQMINSGKNQEDLKQGTNISTIMTARSTKPHIQTLPIELQLQLLSHLSTPSILALRITSHHFHALIPPPTLDQLFDAERSSENRDLDLLACVDCVRLRSVRFFSERMRNLGVVKVFYVGDEGVERVVVGRRGERRCVDCDARPKWARSAWGRV